MRPLAPIPFVDSGLRFWHGTCMNIFKRFILCVSGISLLVAAFGLAKLVLPAVETWSEGKELFFGAALVAIIACSFMAAVRLTRRPAVAS